MVFNKQVIICGKSGEDRSKIKIYANATLYNYVIVNVRVGWYSVVDNVLATEAARIFINHLKDIINQEVTDVISIL